MPLLSKRMADPDGLNLDHLLGLIIQPHCRINGYFWFLDCSTGTTTGRLGLPEEFTAMLFMLCR